MCILPYITSNINYIIYNANFFLLQHLFVEKIMLADSSLQRDTPMTS